MALGGEAQRVLSLQSGLSAKLDLLEAHQAQVRVVLAQACAPHALHVHPHHSQS